LLDPDVEWEWSESGASLLGGPRVYRGPKGVEAATREWLEVWEWFWIEAEEIIDAGDQVVALTHNQGKPKHGGAEVSDRRAEVWTLRNGKVIRHKSYDDRTEALLAAGVSK
jgi:ketosteroid isomerase-like protein